MNRNDFSNALRILWALDAHELPGLAPHRWTLFRGDPARFFYRASDDEEASIIWRAIEKRMQEPQESPQARADRIRAEKERQWEGTPLGKAFLQYQVAHAEYWNSNSDQSLTIKERYELNEAHKAARAEFLMILRGW